MFLILSIFTEIRKCRLSKWLQQTKNIYVTHLIMDCYVSRACAWAYIKADIYPCCNVFLHMTISNTWYLLFH